MLPSNDIEMIDNQWLKSYESIPRLETESQYVTILKHFIRLETTFYHITIMIIMASSSFQNMEYDDL